MNACETLTPLADATLWLCTLPLLFVQGCRAGCAVTVAERQQRGAAIGRHDRGRLQPVGTVGGGLRNSVTQGHLLDGVVRRVLNAARVRRSGWRRSVLHLRESPRPIQRVRHLPQGRVRQRLELPDGPITVVAKRVVGACRGLLAAQHEAPVIEAGEVRARDAVADPREFSQRTCDRDAGAAGLGCRVERKPIVTVSHRGRSDAAARVCLAHRQVQSIIGCRHRDLARLGELARGQIAAEIVGVAGGAALRINRLHQPLEAVVSERARLRSLGHGQEVVQGVVAVGGGQDRLGGHADRLPIPRGLVFHDLRQAPERVAGGLAGLVLRGGVQSEGQRAGVAGFRHRSIRRRHGADTAQPVVGGRASASGSANPLRLAAWVRLPPG